MRTKTNKDIFFDGFVRVIKEQEVDVRLKAWDSDKDAAISAHKLILVPTSSSSSTPFAFIIHMIQ